MARAAAESAGLQRALQGPGPPLGPPLVLGGAAEVDIGGGSDEAVVGGGVETTVRGGGVADDGVAGVECDVLGAGVAAGGRVVAVAVAVAGCSCTMSVPALGAEPDQVRQVLPIEQDVRGLHSPVHHAPVVCVRQGVGQHTADPQPLIEWPR
ncbi:MAG TPA: hypothetical protein VFW65_08095, partial [Pseudonocardiaceae bacterium]|nr:hypothetical protein [Pseudonocardiaceae bacterium]